MMDGIVVLITYILLNGLVLIMVNADIMVYTNYSHQIEVEFRDMPSLFGGIIPQEGMQVMLVYANPSLACTPIAPPPNSNITGGVKWAVLIKRSNCSFEQKVRMAQNASYDIAIVHNVNSSELEPMSAANSQGIIIPSIFVGANTGNYLMKNYQWYNGYFLLIDSNSPDNRRLFVPFAIVVGICFLIMLGFMVGVVVKCVQDRRRAHRHRLPTSSLKKIPTAKFQKGDPYDVCAICIEDYIEGDKLRILPCSHAYHTKCIDPWLTRNRRVCPICKRKVFAAGEKPPAAASSDSDSDSDGVVDDRTPLVSASGRNTTQGGTFDNMSDDLLRRQVSQLWRPHSLSSSASSEYANTRSNSSVNSHITDMESNSTRNALGASDVDSNDVFTVPGTSILPNNGDVQAAREEPEERRGWFQWNIFN